MTKAFVAGNSVRVRTIGAQWGGRENRIRFSACGKKKGTTTDALEHGGETWGGLQWGKASPHRRSPPNSRNRVEGCAVGSYLRLEPQQWTYLGLSEK